MTDALGVPSLSVDFGCVFCRLKFDQALINDPTNEILVDGHYHYVLAGLGAWTPGYLLLVTHLHIDNFSAIPTAWMAEFMELYARVENAIIKEFGQITIFEHGDYARNGSAGGCVSHAHIHFIAKDVRLIDQLQSDFESYQVSASAFSSTTTDGPYLFVKERDRPATVFLVRQELPTQFLRRKIANQLHLADRWDYRIYPFEENVLKTIQIFRGKI